MSLIKDNRKRIGWSKGLKLKPERYIRIWFAKLDQRISNSEELSKKRRELVTGEKNPFFGKHHSEESKLKISEAHKGKKMPLHVKQILIKRNTGSKRPIGTGEKIASTKRGKKRPIFSEVWKRNIGIGHKGQIPWIKGKKHTKYTLEKLRIASLGNKYSYGKIHSEETRRRMSESKKGKPKSEEWKNKAKERRKYQIFPIKDTKPEKIMQIALTLNNIKFRKHVPFKIGNTYHQVDLLVEPSICIEIDGEHWHANPKKYLPDDKISKGKKAKDIWKRDELINIELKNMKYHVIRFWENDVLKDAQQCVKDIKNIIETMTDNTTEVKVV